MKEYIEIGIYLNVELAEELLINILIPNTPFIMMIYLIKMKKLSRFPSTLL
jgi:hypothetical protein